MKKIFFFGCIIAAILSSCDKIEKPYLATTTGGTDTATHVRKVLIEDFTGQKCGNCPVAAITINTIKGIHVDKIISIAVHANFYAVPGAAPYTYDFRTTTGNDYDVFFAPPNFPNGLINRKDYSLSGGHWKSVSAWSAIVDTLLALPPDADIKITNNYNTATRVLNTSIRTQFLTPMTGNYKLMVVLTEDSIVKPQTDYSQPVGQQDVLNYVHRHALRAAISSTSWGDVIATGSVAPGDTVVTPFQYTLPATYAGLAPIEDHCYVIAYVYDAATYQVVQVEEKKIK